MLLTVKLINKKQSKKIEWSLFFDHDFFHIVFSRCFATIRQKTIIKISGIFSIFKPRNKNNFKINTHKGL